MQRGKMAKVSVIIPSRNELFLNKTIDDVFKKASGDIEVIAVLEGYWPEVMVEERPNLIYIHNGKPKGLRGASNAAAAIAKGKYLMKIDAHCMFAEGFDEVLQKDIESNWVVIPRRHSLDPENWCIQQNGKPPRDYHALCFPDPNKNHDFGMHGIEWPQRGRERSDPKYDIDDTPSCQGSCWFMEKAWFDNFLHGMNEFGYGSFSQEFQEIGNKTWLGGGEVKVNKKTWYAHLHKGRTYGRMYHQDSNEVVAGHNYSAWYWTTNQWPDRIHDLSWLVEKFWPMPTWPLDWEKQINDFWPNFYKGNDPHE
jgi:glycosyltransferase involved in cell wall biosynthesis